MADTRTPETQTNQSRPDQDKKLNQTMQHEQAKAEVSGNKQDQSREKSAIGGAETGTQTGEPGRARNELDEKTNPSGQSKSETTGQQR